MITTLRGLRAAVKANPTDSDLLRVLADALADAGQEKASQKQRQLADRLDRQAHVRATPGSFSLTSSQEARIRKIAGEGRCPVKIARGEDAGIAPTVRGERAYHTFRDSDTVVKFPGSALRAGYKLDYHASTIRVVVGIDWLIAQGYVR